MSVNSHHWTMTVSHAFWTLAGSFLKIEILWISIYSINFIQPWLLVNSSRQLTMDWNYICVLLFSIIFSMSCHDSETCSKAAAAAGTNSLTEQYNFTSYQIGIKRINCFSIFHHFARFYIRKFHLLASAPLVKRKGFTLWNWLSGFESTF